MTRYRRGKSFGFYVGAAKRDCIVPEKIDLLLHGEVLKNPPIITSLKPQEKEMPDLKTALTTALESTKRESLNATLDAWDKDEQQQLKGEFKMTKHNAHPTMPHPTIKGARMFGITNNVTRITFQYIKDNPYCLSGDVVASLIPQGFKKGSVTPIITHLVKAGQVQRSTETRRLLALVHEYVPIPSKVMKLRVGEIDSLGSGGRKKAVPAEATEERVKRKYTKRAQAEGIAALTQPVVEEAPRATTTLLLNRNWTAQGTVDKLSVTQARQLYDLLKTIFGG
jgi:hypothetical protein